MRRQLLPALLMTVVLTVLTGVAYPLIVTGVSQVAFRHEANGSLVRRDGYVVGSSLIGQAFARPEYFHPRPSAAGDGYDAMASAGSNLGPSNQALLDTVRDRTDAYRAENRLDETVRVPADAVTASGSGLDPDISVANARLQAPRIADARSLDVGVVLDLINRHTDDRPLGFLGEKVVNVLRLNLDLDRI